MKTLLKSEAILPKSRLLSAQAYSSLCEVIPGGVNSPVRAFKGLGISPLIVEHAAKDMIFDIDGHGYIDFCGSWGPLIHGHANAEILAAAKAQMELGTTFGVSSMIEERLARKIIQHFPSIEKIRFVSSGTEATMSAVRLARGYTGKNLIVKFSGNYHGHSDFFLVEAGSGVFGMNPTSSSSGVPQDIIRNTHCLPYNNTEICRRYLLDPAYCKEIAAVIIEPIAGNMGCVVSDHSFLEMLRDVTEQIGALLIFDEVMTGFRVSLGGAQEIYNIRPDITCFGKIIGGGFPAAAFGGRAEIMENLAPQGTIYQAGTLSGNPVAMAAGLKTIELLERRGIYRDLERRTQLITMPIKKIIEEKGVDACIQECGSMFTIFFGIKSARDMSDVQKANSSVFADFFRYLFNHGVYIPPSQFESWFVSTVHTDEHLEKTRDLIINYFYTHYI